MKTKLSGWFVNLNHPKFGYHWIWMIPLYYAIIGLDKVITITKNIFGVK